MSEEIPYRVWEKHNTHECEADTVLAHSPKEAATYHAQLLANEGEIPDHLGHPMDILVRDPRTMAVTLVTIDWEYEPVAYAAKVAELGPILKTDD